LEILTESLPVRNRLWKPLGQAASDWIRHPSQPDCRMDSNLGTVLVRVRCEPTCHRQGRNVRKSASNSFTWQWHHSDGIMVL